MLTNDAVEKILTVFKSKGHLTYADEQVTQEQHALQAATFAREKKGSPSLVLAALLHDIGHLLSKESWPELITDNLDDRHETLGKLFLEKLGCPEIGELAALHVDAKRYLCSTDEAYFNLLSPTSQKSFIDQGGYMTQDEILKFESNDLFQDALFLRKCDDLAKEPDAKTDSLVDFLTHYSLNPKC